MKSRAPVWDPPPILEEDHTRWWLPVASIWLLGLACFSMPGREGPVGLGRLDPIAAAKMAARAAALAGLGVVALRAGTRPRRRQVFLTLLPLGLFVAWSLLSVGWSALPAVSLGQAVGLLALLLLAVAIGLCWRGPRDTSLVLRHLVLVMLAYTLIVLAADCISHDVSGLNRVREEGAEGAMGLVHPTAAGATASLGLLLLVGTYSAWRWRWSRWLLIPGGAAFVALGFVAKSRMAMAMAMITMPLALALLGRRRLLAAAVVLGGLAVATYVLLDPGLEMLDQTMGGVAGFVQRGETGDQMSTFNGRLEMWDAMWRSYLRSPVIGHGYFVSSVTGQMEVWERSANHSAHNLLLQVLVSTGAVGAALFILGLLWPSIRFTRVAFGRSRKLVILLGLLALWYLGWGSLSSSFMGPVEPESVALFALLGLAVGRTAGRRDAGEGAR